MSATPGIFSLYEAQQAILSCITPLATENVPLDQALGRIPFVSLKSTVPKPVFDQSTRDGFAVADIPAQFAEYSEISLPVIGEIAAGSTAERPLRRGQAVRIMTGAMLPRGCRRVLPFEVCREVEGRVIVPAAELRREQLYIRKKGHDLAAGRVLVRQGQMLRPDHLLLLAENGYAAIDVVCRPGVEILCTGSELVDPGERVGAGQKVSGNAILLSGLVAGAGGFCMRSATVPDRMEEIRDALAERLRLRPQLIVTTGGMGPGKFDLMEEVFANLGGQVVYNRLKMRPGKSTLFGIIDGVPLFALPGPPPAVLLLFHELVAPALRRMQGMRAAMPRKVQAWLQEDLELRRAGRMNLKAAVAFLESGRLMVRAAKKTDVVNAVLLLPANRKHFRSGDRLTVDLVGDVR